MRIMLFSPKVVADMVDNPVHTSSMPFIKQLVGAVSTWGLFGAGFLADLKDGLQIVAFLLAIAVSATTLITWSRNNSKKRPPPCGN